MEIKKRHGPGAFFIRYEEVTSKKSSKVISREDDDEDDEDADDALSYFERLASM